MRQKLSLTNTTPIHDQKILRPIYVEFDIQKIWHLFQNGVFLCLIRAIKSSLIWCVVIYECYCSFCGAILYFFSVICSFPQAVYNLPASLWSTLFLLVISCSRDIHNSLAVSFVANTKYRRIGLLALVNRESVLRFVGAGLVVTFFRQYLQADVVLPLCLGLLHFIMQVSLLDSLRFMVTTFPNKVLKCVVLLFKFGRDYILWDIAAPFFIFVEALGMQDRFGVWSHIMFPLLCVRTLSFLFCFILLVCCRIYGSSPTIWEYICVGFQCSWQSMWGVSYHRWISFPQLAWFYLSHDDRSNHFIDLTIDVKDLEYIRLGRVNTPTQPSQNGARVTSRPQWRYRLGRIGPSVPKNIFRIAGAYLVAIDAKDCRDVPFNRIEKILATARKAGGVITLRFVKDAYASTNMTMKKMRAEVLSTTKKILLLKILQYWMEGNAHPSMTFNEAYTMVQLSFSKSYTGRGPNAFKLKKAEFLQLMEKIGFDYNEKPAAYHLCRKKGKGRKSKYSGTFTADARSLLLKNKRATPLIRGIFESKERPDPSTIEAYHEMCIRDIRNMKSSLKQTLLDVSRQVEVAELRAEKDIVTSVLAGAEDMIAQLQQKIALLEGRNDKTSPETLSKVARLKAMGFDKFADDSFILQALQKHCGSIVQTINYLLSVGKNCAACIPASLFEDENEIFLAQLWSMGLTRVHVPPDGSCLFHAIGVFVGKSGPEVRAEVCLFMEGNPNIFSEKVSGDLSIYIHRMRASNTWGGQVEIAAAAMLYRRPIVLYTLGTMDPLVHSIGLDGRSLSDGDDICLLYNGSTHYDALITSNLDSQSIGDLSKDQKNLMTAMGKFVRDEFLSMTSNIFGSGRVRDHAIKSPISPDEARSHAVNLDGLTQSDPRPGLFSRMAQSARTILGKRKGQKKTPRQPKKSVKKAAKLTSADWLLRWFTSKTVNMSSRVQKYLLHVQIGELVGLFQSQMVMLSSVPPIRLMVFVNLLISMYFASGHILDITKSWNFTVPDAYAGPHKPGELLTVKDFAFKQIADDGNDKDVAPSIKSGPSERQKFPSRDAPFKDVMATWNLDGHEVKIVLSNSMENPLSKFHKFFNVVNDVLLQCFGWITGKAIPLTRAERSDYTSGSNIYGCAFLYDNEVVGAAKVAEISRSHLRIENFGVYESVRSYGFGGLFSTLLVQQLLLPIWTLRSSVPVIDLHAIDSESVRGLWRKNAFIRSGKNGGPPGCVHMVYDKHGKYYFPANRLKALEKKEKIPVASLIASAAEKRRAKAQQSWEQLVKDETEPSSRDINLQQ